MRAAALGLRSSGLTACVAQLQGDDGEGHRKRSGERDGRVLVPALLPTFHVVIGGLHRLQGQEMTGHSESRGLSGWGCSFLIPPAGGGDPRGVWARGQGLEVWGGGPPGESPV